MNKKSITILVVCLIVSVMSVSLAFFSARIIGNGKNVSVNAKELTINFDNNNEIASGIIEPGWSSTNTFSVENKSKASFTYDIVLKNYKNTTKTNGYLVYKITSTNGYNMTEYKDMPKDGENTYDLVIARGITIEPGSSNKQSYTLEIKYLDSTEDQSIDMGSTVTGSLYIVESTTNENNPYTEGTLGYQIMEDNSNIKTRTDFSQMYEDVNIGTMYKATEDNTDVYYFAGDVRNNWVKFGVFESDVIVYRGYNTDYPYLPFREYDTLEECQNGSDNYKNNCTMHKYASAGDPIYWRIIRTNSDGSIRLLYAGTSPDTSEGIIGVSAYNNTGYHSDPMYVGYMYGTSGSLENNKTNENSSDIKKFIDHWYEKYFINYTKYLSTTAAFCNSRVLGKNQDYSISSAFNYEAMDRLYNDTIIKPTYDCSDINDKFTVDQVAGNGKLTYPIALMTADEVSYAGGSFTKYSNNVILWYSSNSKGRDIISNYFFINDALNATPDTYLMTAMKYETTAKTATLENANRLGILRWGLNYMPNAVRPVISLKKDLLYKSGDGSATNPYEVEDMPDTLSERLLSDKSTRPSGPRGTGFDKVYAENNTNTLYTSTEDSKTVYYFAGNATDNWVKFGKNASNQDLYWRIIRTNSDGSVRLLYHGTSTTATDAYIGTSAFNSSVDNIAYVSYMYGSLGSIPNARTNQTNSSTIKTTIDNWYTSNLEAKGYTKYLSTTAVYCNDRTYTVSDYTYFGAYTRLRTNDTPSYDCATTEDKFTVDTSTGNGKLTYPIALMTADEVSFAGGVYLKNAETWYYYNSANGSSTGSTLWWLLSPNGWYGSSASVFIVFGSSLPGYLSNSGVNDTYGVRPVISIKGENLWKSGDGTASSPYEIITD